VARHRRAVVGEVLAVFGETVFVQQHAGYRRPSLAQYDAKVSVKITLLQVYFNCFLYEAAQVS